MAGLSPVSPLSRQHRIRAGLPVNRIRPRTTMDGQFPMAIAAMRWMTATKRSWPGSRAATSRRSGTLARRHLPAMRRARPPHPRQCSRRRGRGAGSHVAGLDPCSALAAAGAFRTWLSRVVVNLCLDRKRRAPWVELEAAGEHRRSRRRGPANRPSTTSATGWCRRPSRNCRSASARRSCSLTARA